MIVVILLLASIAFQWAKHRAISLVGGTRGIRNLHSLPAYYGMYVALWCALPALAVLGVWHLFGDRVVIGMVLAQMPLAFQNLPADQAGLLLNDLRNVVAGAIPMDTVRPEIVAAAHHWQQLNAQSAVAGGLLALSVAIIVGVLALRTVRSDLRARNRVEKMAEWALLASSGIAVLTTVGILASVLYEAIHFFHFVSPIDFLFGTTWSPQMAMRDDQVGSSGAFGAVPLFAGTLLIALIALVVSVPVGLFSAIFLAEYAARSVRTVIKPLLEILAGIPTVVYGFFAALTVGPLLRDFGVSVGLTVASESALSAGLVMGVMIIPFISSIADDMITAVPQSLRDGAYALGATRSETIRNVVLPAALPGIVGGVLLAASRAIGETMIVVMAAGLSANLTANPFQAVTTVTVQIATLLVGDSEFDSPKTLAAFALGLVLFFATLVLNVIALKVVRKYREQYD
jgi:phosphate transport system permease protein